MQTQNPFFDDIAKMMNGAMGVASGMRDEMETRFREWFEGAASRMDLVGREEFEAVKAMAVKAREENEALAKRVAELEAALAGKTAAGARASAGKASRPRKAAGTRAKTGAGNAAKGNAAKGGDAGKTTGGGGSES